MDLELGDQPLYKSSALRTSEVKCPLLAESTSETKCSPGPKCLISIGAKQIASIGWSVAECSPLARKNRSALSQHALGEVIFMARTKVLSFRTSLVKCSLA